MMTTASKKKILIVDDQPENIHILIEHLESEYDILFATNGTKALDIARSDNQPDLILLDVLMPGLNGYEVCALLKSDSRTGDIPIIFVTALSEETDEAAGFHLGADDFITKPFKMAVVKVRITAVLKLRDEMARRKKLTIELETLNRTLEEKVRKKTKALRESNERLRLSEKRFRSIFENAVEGIFQTTPEGEILNVSPSLAHILGYASPKELLYYIPSAKNFYTHSVDRNTFRDTLEQHGAVSGFETRFTKKDGTEIRVTLYAKRFYDERRKVVFYQGFVVDVTEQVRLKEMMVESEKMLTIGGLAAGMAHEINGPLSGLMQTSQLMASRLGPKLNIPAARNAAEAAGTTIEAIERFMAARSIPRMLETIHATGRRIAEVIDNMLSFARKSDATITCINIEALIDRTLELAGQDYDLKKSYDFKSIQIKKAYAEHIPEIPCEASKIQQVLLNIFQNGAQAMHKKNPEAGYAPCFTITLDIDSCNERKKNMLRLEIEDNGPGMDKETASRVFEPFFTTKPVGEGTGLGLSVSYFIITQNHGGTLEVTSELGVGSTFIVCLPLKSSRTHRSETSPK